MTPQDLAGLLQLLYREADEKLRQDFRRSLPFADALFDRWERARRLGFAEGASIYNSSLVFGDVTVGEQSWIGPFTMLDGSAAPLRIGAYVSISSGVHVYTHDTVKWALSRGAISKTIGGVSIGDCVYIGPQSIIVAGVTIGACSVVGANSFVNRDVEPRSIVAGNPARPIGRVTGENTDVALEYFASDKNE